MKLKAIIPLASLLLIIFFSAKGQENKPKSVSTLMGHRFLTFNTVIRVNQIEVSRNRNVGNDERALHTPAKVIAFRNAVAEGFPGGGGNDLGVQLAGIARHQCQLS